VRLIRAVAFTIVRLLDRLPIPRVDYGSLNSARRHRLKAAQLHRKCFPTHFIPGAMLRMPLAAAARLVSLGERSHDAFMIIWPGIIDTQNGRR
jgi:hypothetical protein